MKKLQTEKGHKSNIQRTKCCCVRWGSPEAEPEIGILVKLIY